MSLARLLEQAAGAEDAAAAREALWKRMLRSSADLSAVLRALARASDAAREAAGDWLFNPQSEQAHELGLALARAAREVLALCAARPGDWCREGLASCAALAGGAVLRDLLGLARHEEWAARVVAVLPTGLVLPGGLEPAAWLARARLGRSERARLGRLAQAGDWPSLARLDRDHLTYALAQGGPSSAAAAAPALAWPGGDLELLEQIAAIATREGRAAFALAQALSRQERRPVLLMGNASLGGPPLWAAPGPWQQGWADLRPITRPPASTLNDLARLRAQRLAAPVLRRALWELGCAVALRGRGRKELAGLLAQARPWLAPGEAEKIEQGRLPLALGELPLPQALAQAQAALATVSTCRRQGRSALALIHGLAGGQGRLPRGRALVLPWVDKFVASTGKAADHLYLADLAAGMARLSSPPLMLLIDETIHPAASSLRVVLEAAGWRRPELVLRGLGCFGATEEPTDLTADALAAARGAHALALRATPGPHPVAGIVERLTGRALTRPLSPASRDGADYLLAGTALEQLAGHGTRPGQREPSSWLLTGQGFAPLGAWLRMRVRTLAGVQYPPLGKAGSFWRRYGELTNLG